MSELFLNANMPKVLILAGTDRLDTALIRGQMQGKTLYMFPWLNYYILKKLKRKISTRDII